MKLFKNKKGSELTEKIMVAGFSVAAAAAVIIWMVGIINISKAVDINGNGSGAGGATLKFQGKKKVAWNMSGDQEWALAQRLSQLQKDQGLDSNEAARELARQIYGTGGGYVPEMFREDSDMAYFGTASFSTLPSNDVIASSVGGSSATFVGSGYADLIGASLIEAPVGKALVFTLLCLNQDNITQEVKTFSETCTEGEDACQQMLLRNYVLNGSQLVCSLSGSGNMTFSYHMSGLNQERCADALTQSDSYAFGEGNFAYACYNVDGEELPFIYNSEDGKLYSINMDVVGDAVLDSVQPASCQYFSATLLD